MLPSTSSLSAKIWVGLLTLLLLLSLNSAVLLLGSYRLTHLRERVERIHAELLGIEHIYSTAVDAETGQRGYLLTGEERYLEPYRQALRGMHARLACWNFMQPDLHAVLTFRAHFRGGTGNARSAHILYGDDRTGLKRLQCCLDE